MKVVHLKDPQDEALWDHFVMGHAQASGYHTLAWRAVISNAFGHSTYYLMARDEGGMVRGGSSSGADEESDVRVLPDIHGFL